MQFMVVHVVCDVIQGLEKEILEYILFTNKMERYRFDKLGLFFKFKIIN